MTYAAMIDSCGMSGLYRKRSVFPFRASAVIDALLVAARSAMLETVLRASQCGAFGSKIVSIGSSSASSPSYSAWRPSARMPITSLRRSGVLRTPAELRTIRRVLMSWSALCATTSAPSSLVARETNADGESVCTPYETSSEPSWRASLMAFTLSYDFITILS